MGYEINTSNVRNQLASINRTLSDNVTSCSQAKVAIGAYQNSTALAGAAYRASKDHYDKHHTLLDGMITYIDDMLAVNRAYQGKLCYLSELVHYNQDKLERTLQTTNSLIAQLPEGINTFQNSLNTLKRRVERQLNQLDQFVKDTSGLYDTADSSLTTLNAAMSQMSQVTFNPVTKTFTYPPGF